MVLAASLYVTEVAPLPDIIAPITSLISSSVLCVLVLVSVELIVTTPVESL